MYQDRGGRRDYQVNKSNKIYVSNLSNSTTESELRELFNQFGPIDSVNLKQKDTITFAFIQFSSQTEAEAAINSMNGKNVAGQDIRVQFARGGNDRRNFNDRGGRGRPYGDRGGYQNRSYEGGDRPARRDFGDRPRGCFNCGEEGHMIKDCTKERKPREFNNNREGGFQRRGGYNREGGDRSYGNNDRGGDRSYGGGRSYGGDRGGSNSRGGSGGYNKRRRSSSSQKGGRRSRSNQKRGGRQQQRSSSSRSR